MKRDINAFWKALDVKIVPVSYMEYYLGLQDENAVVDRIKKDLGLNNVEIKSIGDTRFVIAEKNANNSKYMKLLSIFMKKDLTPEESKGIFKFNSVTDWKDILSHYDASLTEKEISAFFKHFSKLSMVLNVEKNGQPLYSPVIKIVKDNAIQNLAAREQDLSSVVMKEPGGLLGETNVFFGSTTVISEPATDRIFLDDVKKEFSRAGPDEIMSFIKNVRDKFLGIAVFHNGKEITLIFKRFKEGVLHDPDYMGGMYYAMEALALGIFGNNKEVPKKVVYGSGKECLAVQGMYTTVVVLFDGTVPEYIYEKVKTRFIPEFEMKYFYELSGEEIPQIKKMTDYSEFLYDLLLPT